VAVPAAALRPAGLGKLARLLDQGTLGRRGSQEIFGELFRSGGDPEELAKARDLLQISDQGALSALAAEAVARHPGEVKKYLEGQEKILSFLVGQVMRASRGAADPKAAGEALKAAMAAKGAQGGDGDGN
jgi:aspartyl-tRNA(Asn)/glutamyl-tRNA(Gln) amidotransferase subunit B